MKEFGLSLATRKKNLVEVSASTAHRKVLLLSPCDLEAALPHTLRTMSVTFKKLASQRNGSSKSLKSLKRSTSSLRTPRCSTGWIWWVLTLVSASGSYSRTLTSSLVLLPPFG